jgi:hypothetical protein
MPRSDAVRADLTCSNKKLVELQVVVAQSAWNGSSPGKVFADEGLNNLGFESILLVNDVVRDVELLSNVARVIHIVNRATAALDSLRHALMSSKAALVPKLKRESDDGIALGTQQCGDGGRIDSSGHGYGDDLALVLGRIEHGVLLSAASSIFAFLIDFRGLGEFKSRVLSANERGFLNVNTFFEFLSQRGGKSRDWKARFW